MFHKCLLVGALKEMKNIVARQSYCFTCLYGFKVLKIEHRLKVMHDDFEDADEDKFANIFNDLVVAARAPPSYCVLCKAQLEHGDETIILRENKLIPCKRVDGQLYYRCPDGKVGMPLLASGFIDWSYLKENSTFEDSASECGSCATCDTDSDTEEGEVKKETEV